MIVKMWIGFFQESIYSHIKVLIIQLLFQN